MIERSHKILPCLCGIVLICSGQKASVSSQPSPIDTLVSCTQVEQLLQRVDTTYRHFRVDSLLRFEDKRVQYQYRQAGVKAWERADFDGNGRMDLLVTGNYYEEGGKVLCLLDMDNGKLIVEPFDRQFYRSCPIVRVEYSGKQPLLRYQDYAPSVLEIDSLKNKEDFLLTHKFGGFVEYNPKPLAGVVWDSITYQSEFVYDEYEQFKLTMSSNGKATYRFQGWPVLQKRKKRFEALTTQITAGSLDSINVLIAYMASSRFKNRYEVQMNHVPYTQLTIAYHTGAKVNLLDVGEQGTFGLVRLYTLLRQLRKTQLWHPISSSKRQTVK